MKMKPCKTSFFLVLAFLSMLIACCSAKAPTSTYPIIEGKEYQLALSISNFGDGVEKRQAAMNEYFDIIKLKLGLEDFDTRFENKTDLRQFGRYDTKHCTPSQPLLELYFRTRIYFEGSHKGISTIDAKNAAKGETREQALKGPVNASEAYFDQADQDIEEDVHFCYRDWARTTKIVFKDEPLPVIQKCGDLRELFPDTFDPSVDEEPVTNNFHPLYTTYVATLVGLMPSTSELEITFTIEYDNPDQARNAVNGRSGEFSMTYTGMNGGFYGFSRTELLKMESLYVLLRDEFGSPGREDCAKTPQHPGLPVPHSNNKPHEHNNSTNESPDQNISNTIDGNLSTDGEYYPPYLSFNSSFVEPESSDAVSLLSFPSFFAFAFSFMFAVPFVALLV